VLADHLATIERKCRAVLATALDQIIREDEYQTVTLC
jgi:hypothetical protein